MSRFASLERDRQAGNRAQWMRSVLSVAPPGGGACAEGVFVGGAADDLAAEEGRERGVVFG